jgi:RNA-directed DNA polymerase
MLAVTEVADGHAVVNGPEGEPGDWDGMDWRQVEQDVRRLRQRIFAASKARDLKKVRNLQKLSLRSRASALLSVRRVTELNAGRLTAGVDSKVVVGAQLKAEWADWVQNRSGSWTPNRLGACMCPRPTESSVPSVFP